jgi:hypothetical protein
VTLGARYGSVGERDRGHVPGLNRLRKMGAAAAALPAVRRDLFLAQKAPRCDDDNDDDDDDDVVMVVDENEDEDEDKKDGDGGG